MAVRETVHSSHFGTFGRCNERPLDRMGDDEKKAYERVSKTRGMVPGPYKIWVQNPKLTEAILPMGLHYQGRSSLSKAEIEIVVNLTNGKWMAGYSNHEHEWMGEMLGGLPAEKVQALIAGLPTSFDDARQQVVYEVASTLLKPRLLPRGLYQRAIDLLGDAGLTDLIAMIGYFTSVSLTLLAY